MLLVENGKSGKGNCFFRVEDQGYGWGPQTTTQHGSKHGPKLDMSFFSFYFFWGGVFFWVLGKNDPPSQRLEEKGMI